MRKIEWVVQGKAEEGERVRAKFGSEGGESGPHTLPGLCVSCHQEPRLLLFLKILDSSLFL